MRLDDQQLQRGGDRIFPSSMPAPPQPSGLSAINREPEVRAEQVPIEVSLSSSSGPESGFIPRSSTMQCVISGGGSVPLIDP